VEPALSLELEPLGALSPPLEAGDEAESFMHFSFSGPLIDSQVAVLLLLGVDALLELESPVALWLCAHAPDEKASSAAATDAPRIFMFMDGSFRLDCGEKGASAMPFMR
jgi:hypothetical protein